MPKPRMGMVMGGLVPKGRVEWMVRWEVEGCEDGGEDMMGVGGWMGTWGKKE